MDELDLLVRAMDDLVAGLVAAEAPRVALIEVEQHVMGAGFGEKGARWMGPSDDPRVASMRVSFGAELSEVCCEMTTVAPYGTELADPKDPRLDILQALKKPASWLAGKWRLRVPQLDSIAPHEGWFATRKDAVAYGRVHLAVVDFHNAAAEAAVDQWRPMVDAMSE